MRTLSDALKAAQRQKSLKPYHIVKYYNGTSWVDVSSDVLDIIKREEVYSGGAKIVLNNYNGAYNSFDYKGKEVQIHWGVVIGESYETSQAPSVWIYDCDWVTEPGVSELVIIGIDAWERLARWRAFNTEAPGKGFYFNDLSATYTIKGIINWVCTQAGITLGTSINEDNLIDTVKPICFHIPGNEDGRTTIIRLLRMTRCEMIQQGAELKIFYPQASDSSCETYNTDHALLSEIRRKVAAYPNKFTVIGVVSRLAISNVSGTFQAGETITGQTTGATAIILNVAANYLDLIYVSADKAFSQDVNGKYQSEQIQGGTSSATADTTARVVVEVTQGSYASDEASEVGDWEYTMPLDPMDMQYDDAACAVIAEALTKRFERAANRGKILVPMNCGQEIWDVITIENPWTGQTISDARVGRLVGTLVRGRGKIQARYDLLVQLGAYAPIEDPTDREGLLRSVLAYPLPTVMPAQNKVEQWIIPAAMQPHIIDITFSSTGYNNLTWTAGRILFANGTEQAINSGQLTLTGVHFLYAEIGDSTLKNTTDISVVYGPNRIFIAMARIGEASGQNPSISPCYSTISVSFHGTPDAPSGLTADPAFKNIFLSWTNPFDIYMGVIEIWRSATNNRADATLIDECTGTFKVDGPFDYGETYYYWIRVRDKLGRFSAWRPEGATSGVSATTAQVAETDIKTFAITASKIFTKVPIVTGDSWANNDPSSDCISWTAHKLCYDGVEYSISASWTSQKYVYWKKPNTSYTKTSTFPDQSTLGDDGFVIATNVSGVHDLAWNALANIVIGTAYIMEAAIVNALIANLAVDDAKIANIAAGKITTGDIAIDRMISNAANAINQGTIKIEANRVKISGDTEFYSANYNPSLKRQVFNSQPAPPYYVADLWAQGATVYRCTVERLTGGFNPSDWDETATDDTLAATKNKVFRQTTAPTEGMATGDMWLDTDDGDRRYLYTGTEWVAVPFTKIDGAHITTGYLDCTNVNIKSAVTGARQELVGGKTTWYDADGNAKIIIDSSTTPPTIELVDMAVAKGAGFLRPFWADYMVAVSPQEYSRYVLTFHDEGRISIVGDEIEYSTGAVSGDHIHCVVMVPSGAPILTWDKGRYFISTVRFVNTSAQRFLYGIGRGTDWSPAPFYYAFVGFKLDGNHLYGCVRNGSSETLTSTYWTISAAMYGLRVTFLPGSKAIFYVDNGTSETSKEITSGLPSGTTNAFFPFAFYFGTTENAVKDIYPGMSLILQERG